MVAIFNEKSLPYCFSSIESEKLFHSLIQTCDLFYEACNSINSKFYLYVSKSFFEYPIVIGWFAKKTNSKELQFLNQIIKKQLFDNEINLIISLALNQDFIQIAINYNNKQYKHASLPEHFLIHLENIPLWNNFPFTKWKPDFAKEEKLLPVAKLSDYVWLNFIVKDKVWDNIKQREFYWNIFVDKLRHLPGGGVKEAEIATIFSKISLINCFIKSNVCKKPKRKIAEYTYHPKYYLASDNLHGAFEVYNQDEIHQGEWTFYGKKNLSKSVDKARNICK